MTEDKDARVMVAPIPEVLGTKIVARWLLPDPVAGHFVLQKPGLLFISKNDTLLLHRVHADKSRPHTIKLCQDAVEGTHKVCYVAHTCMLYV